MSTLMACVFLSIALPLSFLCLLHNSTPASDLFLKAIPFCCVGCHSSYTETFKSIWTAWPDTCAGLGYAHKKETKGFWLSWYGPKSSTDSLQHLLQLCFPCVRTMLVSTLMPLVHIFSTDCTFCHLFHCSQNVKELEGTWKCAVTFWVKQWDYCWNQSHPLTGTNVCFKIFI